MKCLHTPTIAGTDSITFSQSQYSPPSRQQGIKSGRFFKLLTGLGGGWVYAFGGSFPCDSYIHIHGFLRAEKKCDDFVACRAKHGL